MKIFLWLIIIILVLVGLGIGYRNYLSRIYFQTDKAQRSKNFPNGKYKNRLPNQKFSIKVLWRVSVKYIKGGQNDRKPSKPLPVMKEAVFENPASNPSLKFMWLGHSTLLLEIEGKRILFDPIFSERASFVKWAGPKRFQSTPLTLEQLPKLDAVVVSHDHYDHLDKNAIVTLAKKGVVFFVPLGVNVRLKKWGVKESQVKELDWWDLAELGGLKIGSTPARHFSGRSLFDSNLTLWSTWVIIGKKHRVFFSGDTGPTPEFQEIGQKYGPFDLAFLKIGAYDENWPDIHINPEQAVEAYQHLKARFLVPIHWATFNLGLHSWYEPADRLVVAAANAGANLITPKIGEIVELDAYENKFWWKEFK